MKAELVPLDGGVAIELVKDLTVVGRNEGADVRLDRRSVSKSHCVLVKTDGFLFVRDLASTNGTKVNGQRVRRAALLPGDQLTIGGEKFHVRMGPDAPETASHVKTDMMAQSELEAAAAPCAAEFDERTPRLKKLSNGLQRAVSDPAGSGDLPVPIDPTSLDDDEPTSASHRLRGTSPKSSSALPELDEKEWPLPPLKE
jgi:pSer/pThr/pTyr-binding forkhead associated (FHA) protein